VEMTNFYHFKGLPLRLNSSPGDGDSAARHSYQGSHRH